MRPTFVNDTPYCPICDEALRSYEYDLPLSYCSCGVWFDNKELGTFDFQPFPKPGTKYPTIRPVYVDDIPHCPKCNAQFSITPIHGNWVCHCNVWVKANQHDDQLEIHPLYRPDAIRVNYGGRSYVIMDSKPKP